MTRPHATHDFLPAERLPRRGLARAWAEFWFAPADPVGLHAVRLLAGLLFLSWLLPFAGHHEAFFGLGGWFDTQAYIEASRVPEGVPAPISWSILYLAGDNAPLLTAIYWLSIGILILFTLGIATRVTGVLTWLVVASYTANPAISYDGDTLLLVLSFYLMVGYLLYGIRQYPQRQPRLLAGWLVGPSSALLLGRGAVPSIAANVTLRLLQIHLAIIVCTSGLHKLQFAEWWSGQAPWYVLHSSVATTVEEARRHAGHATSYLAMLSLGAYLALAWQIAFPVYAWRPRWRIVLLGGAVVGWLATAFLYKLPLFGPAYLIGSLCFLTGTEWRWILSWLFRLPGLNAMSDWVHPEERPAESRPRRKEAVAAAALRSR